MTLLTQTAGSLVAILALAGLAWWLRLGGTRRLDSAEAVAQAAGEVEDGFAPVAIACDAEGASALARDAAGRIMVIRRHGNRFAGRVLGPVATARLEEQPGEYNLAVDPGEPRFGKVFLTLPEPEAWADAINGLNGRQDA
ncbi:hypothetical protein [Erythrobacter donghaensis]|uniref:hypothetical protein n=1 Tax=Erythrobacter donghaensis TaxID=267135 RepID=UPI0009BD8AE0|nr:hypothetical protein [Erythrobacter donghaensis]